MYLGSWKIDDLVTFSVNTHNPTTGAATDADVVPTYRIYEDETATPILTGSMALLDSVNTAGFYSEQITASAANGFEKGKSYTIYITATVGTVEGTISHSLQIEAEVDANNVSVDVVTDAASRTASQADVTALATATNLQIVDTNVDLVLLDTNELQTNQGNWLTATGFSTHSAADIWAVATRSLTTFGTLIADIWANITRTLTTGTKDTEIDAIKAVTDIIPDSGSMTSIAQASVATEARLAELDAANLPTDIAAIKTDTAAILLDTNELQTDDIPTRLTTIDGNIAAIPTTPMRGTDNANIVVPDAAGTAATLHGITDGKIDDVQLNITEILDYEAGDWEIVNNQMIFKTKAGATLATYNLTKAAVPDSDSPDKRTKV